MENSKQQQTVEKARSNSAFELWKLLDGERGFKEWQSLLPEEDSWQIKIEKKEKKRLDK